LNGPVPIGFLLELVRTDLIEVLHWHHVAAVVGEPPWQQRIRALVTTLSVRSSTMSSCFTTLKTVCVDRLRFGVLGALDGKT